MQNSLHIGTAFGIPVRIHWTFFALLFGGLLWTPPDLRFEAFTILTVLLVCVLLHELGHSLVARRFGIQVIDITFWPLGGMARMSEIPEDSKIEGLVAIAGPAVNFALALLVLPLLFFEPDSGVSQTFGQGFLSANLMLGFFNLIPAFPMDGGRILRAFLALRYDWLRATEMAVAAGRFCAGMMLAAALAWSLSGGQSICFLLLIPIFIWVSGGRELFAVRLRHAQRQQRGPGFEQSAQSESAPPKEDRRPIVEPPKIGAEDGGGFSEDDIRALEQYRGRMRRPPDTPNS